MNGCFKLYRISHACFRHRILRPFTAFFRHLNQFVFTCHIGSQAEIGEGSLLHHNGVGVVISQYARIGKNCIFHQHVTIGARREAADVPVIGNNVFIGANACILGAIHVGDGAKIGAGSVVLHDVPAGASVVGNPAHVVCLGASNGGNDDSI